MFGSSWVSTVVRSEGQCVCQMWASLRPPGTALRVIDPGLVAIGNGMVQFPVALRGTGLRTGPSTVSTKPRVEASRKHGAESQCTVGAAWGGAHRDAALKARGNRSIGHLAPHLPGPGSSIPIPHPVLPWGGFLCPSLFLPRLLHVHCLWSALPMPSPDPACPQAPAGGGQPETCL